MAEDPSQVVAGYRTAVGTKDVDALVSLYDDEVRVFDLWGHWSHEGIDAWRRVIAGWFGSLGDERVEAEFEEVRSFVSGDIAIVEAFVRYRGLSAAGEPLRSMNNRLTWVLRNSGGRWRILHQHTSAPIHEQTTKAILQRPSGKD